MNGNGNGTLQTVAEADIGSTALLHAVGELVKLNVEIRDTLIGIETLLASGQQPPPLPPAQQKPGKRSYTRLIELLERMDEGGVPDRATIPLED